MYLFSERVRIVMNNKAVVNKQHEICRKGQSAGTMGRVLQMPPDAMTPSIYLHPEILWIKTSRECTIINKIVNNRKDRKEAHLQI